VVALAADYVWWAWLIPVCGVGAFVWDGLFIGTTQTRGMLISSASAAVVFFSVALLLMPLMGNHGLWLANLLYLVVRGLVPTILQRENS
jgi:MATE family multidrug resistance protein